MKNVKVEDEVWEKLMKRKIEKRKKTVNEVIKELMNEEKNNDRIED